MVSIGTIGIAPVRNYYGVSFANSMTGWIVGDNGAILQTTNGGSTSWFAQSSSVTCTLRSVTSVSTTQAWAAGDGTIVIYDGISSWSPIYSSTNAYLNRIQAVDSAYLYADGMNGLILKSTNAGVSWSSLASDMSSNLYGLFFRSRTLGWVAGDNGIISKTVDGNTWTTQIVDSSANFRALTFLSDTTGFAAALGGTIYRTLDGTKWDKYRTDYVYLDMHLGEVSADTTSGSEYIDPSLEDPVVGFPSANRLRLVADVKVSEGLPNPGDYTSVGGIQHYTALLANFVRKVGIANIDASSIIDMRPVVHTISEIDAIVQGSTGVGGQTGIQGQTGVQGITGIQGRTGVQGQTGVSGTTGVRGATGIQGLIGSQGQTGVGLPGPTGIQGPVGPCRERECLRHHIGGFQQWL